ncbi:FHIPEP family type III secretion protein [Cognataquiflexum rubidum]|uniref:FHIPEP family type III secretion protein n=1 Tax=Cognataquiflexum rubidum TaxID=2922273 RepID=UPI001F14841C|nr:FHIPEP family type III secretion protein [Cognataquiflexum rubidum]MCH6235361.1 FHIPEP family type III secretion protein [Cognataquiflexum rubidum]
MDFNFRRQGEITIDRAKRVIQAFEKVIEINAGNIASLGAIANLYWLVGENEKAKKTLTEAIEIKAIAAQTFIGELNYKLARIAAEEGDLLDCRSRYLEAMSADPSMGSASFSEFGKLIHDENESIHSNILLRYEKYWNSVSLHLQTIQNGSDLDFNLMPETENVFNFSKAFVLNDLANVYLRYFHLFGDQLMLLQAKELYEEAKDICPQIAVVWTNLINVYIWMGEWEKTILCFERAKQSAPHWGILAIKSIPHLISAALEKLAKAPEFKAKKGNDRQLTDSKIIPLKFLIIEGGKREVNLDKSLSFGNQSMRSKNKDIVISDLTQYDIYNRKKIGLDENKSRESNQKEEINENDNIALEEAKLLFTEVEKIIKKHTRFSSLMIEDYEQFAEYLVKLPLEQFIEDDFLLIDSLISVLYHSEIESNLDIVLGLCQKYQKIYPQNFDSLRYTNDILIKKIFFWLMEQISLLVSKASPDSVFSTDEMNNQLLAYKEKKNKRIYIFKNEILNTSVEFHKILFKKIRVEEKTKSAPSINFEGTEFDINEKVIDIFYSLNKELAFYPNSNSHISKTIGTLFESFENNFKKLQSLIEFWKDSENGSFLSLYWYFSFEKHRSNTEIQQIISRDSFQSPDSIRNKIGNVFFRLGIFGGGKEFFNRSVELFNEAIIANPSEKKLDTYPNKLKYYANLGIAQFWILEWNKSIFSFREAIKSDKGQAYKKVLEKELAMSVNQIGNQYYSNSENEDAIDNWSHAIKMDGSQGVYYHNLSLGLEKRTLNDYPNSLDETIEALQKSIDLDRDYEHVRPKLNQLKRKRKLLDSIGHEHLKLNPIVNPILVEYHPFLDPLIMKKSGIELKDEITEKLKELRSNIKSRFGVRIPGVLFRHNQYLQTQETVNISINEIPLVRNFIYPDRLCCILKEEEIGNYGDKIEAFNPLEDGKSFWIPKSEISEHADIDFLDPIEYLFLYLEFIFIRNFGELIMMEDISIMCETNLNPEIKAILNSPDQVIGLSKVCKALLVERVPIVDFKEIANFFISQFENSSIEEIIESLRIQNSIKMKLPGNDVLESASWLGSKFEEVLKNNLKFTGKFHYLSLEPQLCQNLLLGFRDGVLAQNPKVIIVPDPRIRIHLKKLIELEFPDLHVLSQREIIGEYLPIPSKTIDYKE